MFHGDSGRPWRRRSSMSGESIDESPDIACCNFESLALLAAAERRSR